MSDRAFGVEIECGFEGGFLAFREHFRQSRFRQWSLGQDGSGIELRTPKLRGKEGFKKLTEVMEWLREIGCYVGRPDGMHVHHNAPELRRDRAATIKLMESWIANQRHINSFVDRYRVGSGSCFQIARPHIERFIEQGRVGGRGALNVGALRTHGSIEIRLHEGCIDPVKAVAWVQFGQRFIEGSIDRKQPIACPDTRDVLLRRIKVPAAAQRTLLRERV